MPKKIYGNVLVLIIIETRKVAQKVVLDPEPPDNKNFEIFVEIINEDHTKLNCHLRKKSKVDMVSVGHLSVIYVDFILGT